MPTYREYLQYAEKYLNQAEDDILPHEKRYWLLVPAVILSWAAMEALINNMLDDFTSLPDSMFELHERAFLQERRIRFNESGEKKGKFSLEGTEYRSLEDKILFLIAKFRRKEINISKGDKLWQELISFKAVRDKLVHPRRGEEISLTPRDVETYIGTAKEIMQFVSFHVWNKKVEF